MRTSPSSSPAARSTARRSIGHMDYGKKDPSLGWRFTDAWLSMAGNGDKGLPNGLPVDEWGIKVNEKSQPGRLLRRARRRHQRPGLGLCHPEVSRLAEGLCTAGSPGHDLRRIRPGPVAGRGRPADVHLHRLHRRLREAGPAGRERGRHAEVAFRAVAAWRLLEGRHEARLPGRRFLDADEVDARTTAPRPPGSMRSSSPRRRST